MEKTRADQMKEIEEFVKAHSDMPSGDVAALFNCSKQDVYHARHKAGVSLPSANKGVRRVRAVVLAEKETQIANLKKKIERLEDRLNVEVIESEWEKKHQAAVHHINHLEKTIASFDKQVVGYKAVISYLEHQLVSAAEKNGTSV